MRRSNLYGWRGAQRPCNLILIQIMAGEKFAAIIMTDITGRASLLPAPCGSTAQFSLTNYRARRQLVNANIKLIIRQAFIGVVKLKCAYLNRPPRTNRGTNFESLANCVISRHFAPSPLLMNIFRDELDTRRILLNASCEEM